MVGSCRPTPSLIPPPPLRPLPTAPHGGRMKGVGRGWGGGVGPVLAQLASCFLTISFLALPCYVLSLLVLSFLSFLAFRYFFFKIVEILIT